MASDDDLRAKLTEAVADSMHCRRYVAPPGCETHRMRSWPCPLAVERTDALMPIIREALAEAWDAGCRASDADLIAALADPEPDAPRSRNPWRGEQP